MNPVILELPFPPTVNTYWRTAVRGKFATTYVSKKGKQYASDVAVVVRERFGNVEPTSKLLSLKIRVVMPDRRKRDLDNLLKAPLDALTKAGVWVDDSQIEEIYIYKVGVEKPGGFEVTISIKDIE